RGSAHARPGRRCWLARRDRRKRSGWPGSEKAPPFRLLANGAGPVEVGAWIALPRSWHAVGAGCSNGSGEPPIIVRELGGDATCPPEPSGASVLVRQRECRYTIRNFTPERTGLWKRSIPCWWAGWC